MDHHPLQPLIRMLLFLALTLQLSACSSTRMAYQFADRGVVWWVEDYVDLTARQEETLLRDLRVLRDWHCETQLPQYSEWLAQLRQETSYGTLSPARIRDYREQVRQFIEPLAARIVPVATHLLESLSDDQVKALVASLQEEQAEYRRVYLQEDTREDAVERVSERAERWLGDLNERQIAVIRQWLADREGATEAWLDGRERWQAAFTNLLATRQEPDFRDRLRDMILNYDQYQGNGYQVRADRNAEDLVRLTHQLLIAADEWQWVHLQEETGDLRQDVVALSCPTNAAA